MHLTLRTGFSFKKCFLHMEDIHNYVEDGVVGIADENNTYGHVFLQREAEKHNFTPIFGVRLGVVPRDSKKRSAGLWHVFIAENPQGLRNLYKLVETAWDQFYYTPRLFEDQVNVPFIYHLTPDIMEQFDDNLYGRPCDKRVYQLMAGARKHGDGFRYLFEDRADPCHILSDFERGVDPSTLSLMERIRDNCKVRIPRAEMVKRPTGSNIIDSAVAGALNKGINLDDPVYNERFEREMQLIHDKDFVDYFMIVSDMCKYAKESMLVGPSRGSSAGSLVCYLLDITEIDPIEYDLVFERFIDVNRDDLPDIDIDFPDVSRGRVIDYLKSTYGKTHVASLANIVTFKPKYAIGEFCKSLGIPTWESEDVRESIIFRSMGDARARMRIVDTLEDTDVGKKFLEKYPQIAPVGEVEGHPAHAGKHAAGVIVATQPLSDYASYNPRDDVLMIEKKNSEYLNLLKIDILGLSTLSVLQECCEAVGMDYRDLYHLPIDDEKTYKLFNDQRLTGIFQFEGDALRTITRQIEVTCFDDLAAITALARPGALNSGGTAKYITYCRGDEQPVYHSDAHRDITEDTKGIVVYQEQMMRIAKEIGDMTWGEVATLRRAASKSMGVEFFNKYKDMFIEGALRNEYTRDVIERIWNDISHSGSWSFNKSHAVSYAMVSYWSAYLKCHYPIDYAVAYLNNANDEIGIKFLRDMVRNENLNYVAVDADISTARWSQKGGVVYGGLQNINGIGPKSAETIVRARTGDARITPSIMKKLMDPVTPYDVIFPGQHYFGRVYDDPRGVGLPRPAEKIVNINGEGDYCFIGTLTRKNIRDLNETVFLEKRGGERIEDNTKYLNFRVEDDTDQMNCTIGRWDYDKYGREIGETGRLFKDWYIIKGKIKSDQWRRVNVESIMNLNKAFGVDL